jgi:hypothetical protein
MTVLIFIVLYIGISNGQTKIDCQILNYSQNTALIILSYENKP